MIALPQQIDWDSFRYVVFDIPKLQIPYTQRYSRLQRLFSPPDRHPFVVVAENQVVTDKRYAEDVFSDLVAVGAEGVIVREPQGKYEHGYSRNLYKLKVCIIR